MKKLAKFFLSTFFCWLFFVGDVFARGGRGIGTGTAGENSILFTILTAVMIGAPLAGIIFFFLKKNTPAIILMTVAALPLWTEIEISLAGAIYDGFIQFHHDATAFISPRWGDMFLDCFIMLVEIILFFVFLLLYPASLSFLYDRQSSEEK